VHRSITSLEFTRDPQLNSQCVGPLTNQLVVVTITFLRYQPVRALALVSNELVAEHRHKKLSKGEQFMVISSAKVDYDLTTTNVAIAQI